MRAFLLVATIITYVAFAVGWIMNLVKLVAGFANESLEVVFAVVRIAGVFLPPLGGIVGYF